MESALPGVHGWQIWHCLVLDVRSHLYDMLLHRYPQQGLQSDASEPQNSPPRHRSLMLWIYGNCFWPRLLTARPRKPIPEEMADVAQKIYHWRHLTHGQTCWPVSKHTPTTPSRYKQRLPVLCGQASLSAILPQLQQQQTSILLTSLDFKSAFPSRRNVQDDFICLEIPVKKGEEEGWLVCATEAVR